MSQKTSFKKSLFLFVLALSAFLGFRWAGYEPFVIPSGSMIPTLLVNDHILVDKSAFGLRWPFTAKWITRLQLPERGDVVVFRSVEQDNYFMVKRVVGLPGDRVRFTDDGDLVINGEKVVSETMSIGQRWTADDLGGDTGGFEWRRETLGARVHDVLLERNGFRYTEPERIIPEDKIFLMGDNRDHSRDSRFWGELPVENLLGRAKWVWLSCTQTLSGVNFMCDPRFLRWQRLLHRIE